MDVTVSIEEGIYKELIELTEERSLPKIVDQAIALLKRAFYYATQGYRIGMVPLNESGEQNYSKPVIFFDLSEF